MILCDFDISIRIVHECLKRKYKYIVTKIQKYLFVDAIAKYMCIMDLSNVIKCQFQNHG